MSKNVSDPPLVWGLGVRVSGEGLATQQTTDSGDCFVINFSLKIKGIVE